MFLSPEFWVLIAFVLLLIGCGKRAFSYLTQTLDSHSQQVKSQLADAERLHEEAVSLLKTYQKKQEEASEQIKKIIAYTEKESLEFKKSSEQSFEHFMDQKEKALLERIAIEEEEMMIKLKQEVVDETLAIVEQTLLRDKKEKKKMTEESLREIKNISIGKLII